MMIALSVVATPMMVALVANPTVPRETSDVSPEGAEAGYGSARVVIGEVLLRLASRAMIGVMKNSTRGRNSAQQ